MVGGPVLNSENLFANLWHAAWVAVFHLATNHALDDALLVNLVGDHAE